MVNSNRWLITGGAGYIGAHIAQEFLQNDHEVLIYDSMHSGLISRIHFLERKFNKKIPTMIADIRDSSKFESFLSEHSPSGIIHAAGLKSVSESFNHPDEYFDVNLTATGRILESAKTYGIHHFIFSSTAAIYGAPEKPQAVKEDDPKDPISPYGKSKLLAEIEVENFLSIPGNFGTSLRYFNVIGASSVELIDNSTENLVPIVLRDIRLGKQPTIFGLNHQTPDGTCVRDYIDVRDVSRAHFLAASAKNNLPHALNIGTGRGVSVREVIDLIISLLDRTDVSIRALDARPGDPSLLCANVDLIGDVCKFYANIPLESSLRSVVLNL